MLITVVLLLAAVGLLLAAIGSGQVGLAWGSVTLSGVVAAMILLRWRRSWRQRHDAPEEPEDESVLLPDEPVDAALSEQPARPAPVATAPVTAAFEVEQGTAVAAEQTGPDEAHLGAAHHSEAQLEETEPGEEDTDAADLLIVYELTDEVLVVDEHPRYHLVRCSWPDHARAERLPVREARELGFTPCQRCRPDTALARKDRAARAAATGGS